MQAPQTFARIETRHTSRRNAYEMQTRFELRLYTRYGREKFATNKCIYIYIYLYTCIYTYIYIHIYIYTYKWGSGSRFRFTSKWPVWPTQEDGPSPFHGLPQPVWPTDGRAFSIPRFAPTQDVLKFEESKRIERARSARARFWCIYIYIYVYIYIYLCHIYIYIWRYVICLAPE